MGTVCIILLLGKGHFRILLHIFILFLLLCKERSTTVDLTTDSSLLVDISDALSEKDKVKFTVHTKVCEIL